MPPLLNAACWSIAAILVALSGAFGLLPAQTANTLVIVLPILMLTTLTARRRCADKVS